MPTFQNDALTQDPSLIIGSVKAEVALVFGGAYVNVGLGRAFALTEEITVFDVEVDNGPDPIEGVSQHELAMTMELVELYLPTLDEIRGGIDLLTATAAAPVVGFSDPFLTGEWGFDDPFVLRNQEGDGSEVVVTSVTGATDGALVEATDYFVGQNEAGDTVVTIIDSVTVTTESQTMTIVYDYTPNASRELSTGGLTTIASRAWRFTNRQIVASVEKDRIINVYTAFFEGGQTLTFNSDSADDPLTVIPISVRGKLSSSRTDGDQLYKILDEVAVA